MSALYTYAPILTCVQDACTRLNLVKPTGVYDSNDENAIFMGSIANEIGPMLQDVFPWQQFRVEWSLAGDASRAAWDLPADFSRIIDDTGWSQSKRRPVIVINAQQWASIKSWLSQSFFVNPACRILNDQLQFMTAPDAGEVITFEYISKDWEIDGDTATKKNRLSKNSDTPMHDSLLFTQALRIKWLENRVMNTTAVQQDFNERFKELTSRNQMAQTLSLNAGSYMGFRYLDNLVNTPDTGLGN